LILGGAFLPPDLFARGYIQCTTFVDAALHKFIVVGLQSMMADVIDYDRLVTGQDRSAMFFRG